MNKKVLCVLLAFGLVLSGCGSSSGNKSDDAQIEELQRQINELKNKDSSSETAESVSTTESPESKETPDTNTSDEAKNVEYKTIKYKGISFQVPTYFSEKLKTKVYDLAYYPKEREEYATLGFEYLKNEDNIEFKFLKKGLKDTIKERYDIKSNKIDDERSITMDGLKTYTIGIKTTEDMGYLLSTVICGKNNKYFIRTELSISRLEGSKYDYINDYYNILKTLNK